MTYHVLLRARELAGRESLTHARARVDRASTPAQLRLALLDEAAICMKRMERLPILEADDGPELDLPIGSADGDQ